MRREAWKTYQVFFLQAQGNFIDGLVASDDGELLIQPSCCCHAVL